MNNNEHKKSPWQANEHGFLLLLVLGASIGLAYLFGNFLMPIIFSMILSLATYPLFEKVQKKYKLNKSNAAGVTTLLISLTLIIPVIYLLINIGFTATTFYDKVPSLVASFDSTNFDAIKTFLTNYTPLNVEMIDFITNKAIGHSSELVDKFKIILVTVSTTLFNSSMSAIAFFSITIFSLFFFYRDGKKIADRLKIISPLDDYYDELLMDEIYTLSGVLTISVFSIAILQGFSFSILTYFLDLDWLFIGVAIAVSSFIPVVGSGLVWIPLSIWLYGTGNVTASIGVLIWGILVAGFIIDNIARPLLLAKIYNLFNTGNKIDSFSPLEHTFLVILSTFGGIMNFGVLGLFLGPIIAALSISIFGVYVIRLENIKNVK